MNQDLYDWLLLLGRWVHITTAVTWIGTSIFFMWLDRSFEPNPESKAKNPGHLGELWMVHGGGFYRVEKLQMGSTQVPEHLHWFKWESYWTWMSGFFLVAMIFYTGDGTFMLDSAVSSLTYPQGVALSLFTIFGSWFFYDLLWESDATKEAPLLGHILTLAWLGGMTWGLCHLMSGRAAYLHIGAVMGTWMTANVFMRIIPRQVKMVQAAQRGESVNPDWAKNAKNRSTHNTYFTLPVIFVMMSNHFPSTYGHAYNWAILLTMTAGGASIREYFVSRIKKPTRARIFGATGVALIAAVIFATRTPEEPVSVQTPPGTVEISGKSSMEGSISVVTPKSAGAAAGSAAAGASNEGTTPTPESGSNADARAGGALSTGATPTSELLTKTGSPATGANGASANAATSATAANSTPLSTLEVGDVPPGLLRGTVNFEGPVPANRKLTNLPLPCAQVHGSEVFTSEVLVQNGHLQNVLLRIVKGHEKLARPPAPATPVELNQVGCMYVPRLIAAQTNQEVVFINSDSVFHNVKSFTKANPEFNLAMPTKGQRISKRFAQPEVFLQTKCSVHPWMGAYIAVVDHPYFAITDANGTFEIRNLPPGTYTVELWHEVFGTQTQTVTLGASGSHALNVSFRKQDTK